MRVDEEYLVDGGLSTNLPLFLFERERSREGLPVVAFDLMSAPSAREGSYNLAQYCADMLSTALESGDYFQQLMIRNVYQVPIRIPSRFRTLDFSLTAAELEYLFTIGHSSASAFFHTAVPQWTQVTNVVESLQAQYVSPRLMGPVLGSVARDVVAATEAQDVRVNVMMPTSYGTRIVVYQYGMDDDPDVDMELASDAGCSGLAWSTGAPAIADLESARTGYVSWGLTQAQQNKVRSDRRAMLSVPIFDPYSPSARKVDDLQVIGVLSVDTSSRLEETGWLTSKAVDTLALTKRWADIIARVLI